MSLATRLTEVIQAIGSDIRALQRAAGGGLAPNSLLGVFPGPVLSQIGTIRYYPRAVMHVTAISIWLNAPATQAVVASVRKNGEIIQQIVLDAGQDKYTKVVEHNFLPTDYITMDIISGSGKDRDLTLRLDY